MQIDQTVNISDFRAVNRNTREYKISKAIFHHLVENKLYDPPSEELKGAHKRRRFEARTGSNAYDANHNRHVRSQFGRYAMMTDQQKEKFLESIRLGMNEAYSADSMQIGWNTYGRTLQGDPDFRKEVEFAKESAKGSLEHVVFTEGFSGNVAACMALLHLKETVEQRKAMRKLERKKVVLKEREIAAKVKAVDHIVDQSHGNLNFSALTSEELEEYSSIYNRIKTLPPGVMLSDEDARIFAFLTQKLASTGRIESQINGNANGVQALNGISKIDDMFDDEEDE